MTNIIYCQHCNINFTTSDKRRKFCSQSCSASHNNKNVRRHGQPVSSCKLCNSPTKSHDRIFCSNKCSSLSRQKPKEQKAISNKSRQATYRAKNYRKLAPDANPIIIKKIYENCPDGHEVDHIIPLSKGGLHHEDNLQYLTIEENRKKGNKIILIGAGTPKSQECY